MRNSQVPFLVAQSMAASFQSSPLDLRNMFGVAIQANYTTNGTLGGTFNLQGSVDRTVDQKGNVLNAGNWLNLTGTSLVISAAGNFLWNVFQVSYPWVRLTYTAAGGDTGTCNAYSFSKGF